MGINDRDYSRPAAGRGPSRSLGGGSGMSAWSVNRWLITICVAVFMLDQFLPPAIAPLQSVALDLPADAVLDQVDRTRLRVPTLKQLTDGKWPVVVNSPKGPVPGPGTPFSCLLNRTSVLYFDVLGRKSANPRRSALRTQTWTDWPQQSKANGWISICPQSCVPPGT